MHNSKLELHLSDRAEQAEENLSAKAGGGRSPERDRFHE